MSLYPPPPVRTAQVWTSLPERFRIADTAPAWAQANKRGHNIDSFLEGPSFDREGNLWVTDIPYGRVFKIDPQGRWELVVQYSGWPNGLKIHRDGRVFITDYQRGIMMLDPRSAEITPVLTHRHTEGFRGVNDLVFDASGLLYFTDQGQSGLHNPNGRVYRYDMTSEKLELLIDTGPSPNGLVPGAGEDLLYVAMTRANAVWRLPMMADGAVSKVGLFVQLSGGGSGPDGLALDQEGGLYVAHAGNGCVWGFNRLGHPISRVQSPNGLMTTNMAFGGDDNRELFITESETGTILRATMPVAGKPMYSHS